MSELRDLSQYVDTIQTSYHSHKYHIYRVLNKSFWTATMLAISHFSENLEQMLEVLKVNNQYKIINDKFSWELITNLVELILS